MMATFWIETVEFIIEIPPLPLRAGALELRLQPPVAERRARADLHRPAARWVPPAAHDHGQVHANPILTSRTAEFQRPELAARFRSYACAGGPGSDSGLGLVTRRLVKTDPKERPL